MKITGPVTCDPRTYGPQPPFDQQPPIEPPGTTAEMNPQPDHGESSYAGSGLLEGLVAVVTGGDSGIGRAVALAFAREGADVVISYLNEGEDAAETERLMREAGRRALRRPGDLRSEERCRALVAGAVEEFGRLDVLVNNAAYQSTNQQTDEITAEEFDRAFKTNVYATFHLSQAALKEMNPGGSIINTTSIQGFDPSGLLLPYAATKSAIASMTRTFAELAIKQGVRVNGVAPGPVWTPLIPSTMPEEAYKKFGTTSVFKRPAQPAEMAHTAVSRSVLQHQTQGTTSPPHGNHPGSYLPYHAGRHRSREQRLDRIPGASPAPAQECPRQRRERFASACLLAPAGRRSFRPQAQEPFEHRKNISFHHAQTYPFLNKPGAGAGRSPLARS